MHAWNDLELQSHGLWWNVYVYVIKSINTGYVRELQRIEHLSGLK